MAGRIVIRGARTHNLQNIDLEIPRGQLVVITGPSGSGKSSLAFDTLFAEGRRQYLDTLSAAARAVLSQIQRPDVDEITGLPPVICVDQQPGRFNPRSTVATTTEIYDHLRLLFARLGEVHCPQCGEPIRPQTPQQIEEQLRLLPEGTRLVLLAPMVRGRKGQHREVLEAIRKAGQVRVRVDGVVYDLDAVGPLDGRRPHDIEAVVDRLIIRHPVPGRLAESLALALQQGKGVVVASYWEPSPQEEPSGGSASAEGRWRDRLFSTLHACPQCQISFEAVEPRLFSFNSPYGACPQCQGLGRCERFDPELVLPDPSRSLARGAIAPWGRPPAGRPRRESAARHSSHSWPPWDAVAAFVQRRGLSLREPLDAWDTAARHALLWGDGEGFPGVLALLEQHWATATDRQTREALSAYRAEVECPACGGTRLKPASLAVKIAGLNIAEVCRQSVAEARAWLTHLARQASLDLAPSAGEQERCGHLPTWSPTPPQRAVAAPLLRELLARLAFLQEVGLGYLTLDRRSDSLSGGELQRVRLASAMGSGLAGVCYILDEPTVGLHPRDNERLLATLQRLRAAGNTVLVVEHDEMAIRQADWIIDMGPGAGAEGGRVVAAGPPAEVIANPQSLTGRYLAGQLQVPVPASRRPAATAPRLVLAGASLHNLKQVTLQVPLGCLVGLTGVSGSGKSSLVLQTLAPALIRALGGVAPRPGPFVALSGAEHLRRVLLVDQSPLGRSPRSNAATYSGVFDEVRQLFAATREARQRGFGAKRFSFNVPGGRCEACQGQGVKRLTMQLLPDLYVPCPECDGKRFNPATLAIRYKGLSIADVLELSVDQALDHFANVPAIDRILRSLAEVGLGYLPLGQPSTQLSGGEAQRIRLATELARGDARPTLYLLDEPTTGLHWSDIGRLLRILNRLVEQGHTVLVIEHHPDVLQCCDWLLELGPEGGEEGGFLIAEGTPEQLAGHPRSATGPYLPRVRSPGS
jgi:excinuclease ABC subunit A